MTTTTPELSVNLDRPEIREALELWREDERLSAEWDRINEERDGISERIRSIEHGLTRWEREWLHAQVKQKP